MTVEHIYHAADVDLITLTATDNQGQTGLPATLALAIGRTEQQGAVLALGGTAEDDAIILAAGPAAGTVVTPFGTFATGQVLGYGGAGTDRW